MFEAFLMNAPVPETTNPVLTYLGRFLTNQGALWALALAKIAFLFAGGHLLSNFLVGNLCKALGRTGLDAAARHFLCNALRGFLFIVVVLAALHIFGVETTSLVAAIGAIGLAVGLALQGSLSNFAAGVLIVMLRPFKAQDLIQTGETLGIVEGIDLLSVRLRTPDNRVVLVPSSSLITQPVINLTELPSRRIDLSIGVSYEDNLKTAKEIIQRVLSADARVLPEPEPLIAVLELGESAVNIAVRPWVRTADYWPTRYDLLEKLKLELETGGCTIPFPQRDVRVRSV
jgi:small conductance mechanosensitive channel